MRCAAKGGRRPVSFGYELLAAFLLTGGRESEVLGLEVDDVSLDRGVVTFRPNGWGRLKTSTSHRSVRLWPQLREILVRYLAERPPGRLLFPSYRTGEEAMVTDFRKVPDPVAGRAGWRTGEIRSKVFRHTYCAARLQTLDQGSPVSVYTVARELGHGGEAMVRKVYGHVGQVGNVLFPSFYQFENGFRILLDAYLTSCYGADWWNLSLQQALPRVFQYSEDQRTKMDAMPWIGDSTRVKVLPVHLVTLGQLEEIVKKYSSDCIPELFPTIEFFLGHMEVIKRVRNLYAHMFPCITKVDCTLAKREIRTLGTHINSRLERYAAAV